MNINEVIGCRIVIIAMVQEKLRYTRVARERGRSLREGEIIESNLRPNPSKRSANPLKRDCGSESFGVGQLLELLLLFRETLKVSRRPRSETRSLSN